MNIGLLRKSIQVCIKQVLQRKKKESMRFLEDSSKFEVEGTV